MVKTEYMWQAPSDMMKRFLCMLTHSHIQYSLTPSCIMEMFQFCDFYHFMKSSVIDYQRFWGEENRTEPNIHDDEL